MKKNDITILLTFIFFLIGPTIIYWFVKTKMDLNNYENRILYSRPEFTFVNITSFPSDYEKYFNDKLPFKNEIRKIRSLINYKVFNISSNERVIIGKNNWFFYDSSLVGDGDSISDYRNTTLFSSNDVNDIIAKMYNVKEQLKQKNIQLYVIVPPNKENVYADHLEKIISKNKSRKSRTEYLIDKINETGNLSIIYPKTELIEGREQYETYFKYDSHWNSYGAYLGVEKLMKEIDKDYKIEFENIDYINYDGDLAKMNLMANKLYSKEPDVKFMSNISANCNNLEINYCESSSSRNETIMLIGDSFSNSMIDYLTKIYKRSVFVERGNYNFNLIETYKPNIIVYEVVERQLDALRTIDILIN